MPISDGIGQTDDKTEVVGGDTIAGSIVSFMNTLHLSYREVYEEIPYLLLLLMMADNPRVIYEDKEKSVIKKMSGKELIRQKKGGY